MTGPTPIRGKRPTAEESDLALIRAALHEQGQLLASLVGAMAKLDAKLDEVVSALARTT